MSSSSGSSQNKGPDNTGSYAPAWEKRSLDVAPPNEQGLPENPVADAIMGVDTPSSETPEQSEQNPPDQPPSDQS